MNEKSEKKLSVAAQLRKKAYYKFADYLIKQHPELGVGDKAKAVSLDDALAVLATHQPKTRIRVLNDTSTELVIRRPPTSHKIQPQKMMLEFVEGNEVFLKIWDGNVMLLSKDMSGGVEAT